MRDANYLQTVVRYIRRNLKKGYTEEALRQALLRQQHSKLEIERAFTLAREEMTHEAPVLKTKPVIKYEIVVNPSSQKQNPEQEKKSFWNKLFG